MSDWNSRQYLKFKNERTQPAVDLARRMELERPSKIADIGCGPGNSTAILLRMFPGVKVIGFDNSENMLAAARQNCPQAEFRNCDASSGLSALDRNFDAVFSNACLQWLPEHDKRIPELMGMLKPGGTLAVQIPMNFEEPIHKIISQVTESAKWTARFPQKRIFYTLGPEEYYGILTGCASEFQIWQTTYYHVLPSQSAILEWYRSTGMKPYLDVLPDAEKPEFETDVMEKVKTSYPAQKNGKVIFRFPRFFFTAVR